MDSFGIYNPKEPEKVNEPDLEKPGLFNKKKVEAVNKQKMVEYQRRVQDYNASYQEYENTISANKRLYEDRKEAGKQRLVDKLESMRSLVLEAVNCIQLSRNVVNSYTQTAPLQILLASES